MAGIWHDEGAGAWLAGMRSASYAFRLAGAGSALRHLYWGPALPREALGDLADRDSEPDEEPPDEYVPWGGLRYDEPSLKADFADGTRGIEWRFAGQRLTRRGPVTTLDIDFADTAYPLLVTLHYRVYDDFDVLERWATLRHRGADADPPIVIRQAHSANWWLPARGGWRLRYLHGAWGAESRLTQAALTPGKLVLESRRGITSHQLSPWFTLDPCGAATEESGEVWSGALAWSGSWKLVFETSSAGRVHACGGLNDFDWSARLAPGGELVLPRFAALHTSGGFGAASREWHAWQRAHVLGRGEPAAGAVPGWSPAPAERGEPAAGVVPGWSPAPAGRGEPPLRPVLYNSWEATAFGVSEDGQARLAGLAARLGVECFVVDDGWFTGRDHDRAGLGDWAPDPVKFPRGLGPLIGRVNDLGMRFGLWVEPEMVNPDSALYRARPDWVYHFANRSRSERRHQLVLNLARPDVAEWVYQTIDKLLSENHVEFVKWDMNRPFSEPGWPGSKDPEQVWVEHVRSLYAILDGLRAAHPGVDFESCASGGGRVDLGILRRVEQVWPSDNTDAWDRILIQEGFTQAYPPQVMAAWVTDSPNFLTGRRLPLRFRFHVAMAGALGIGGNLLRWSDSELAEAAELVALYKDIRPVVQRGSLYRLASGLTGPFGASQYVAGDGSSTVMLAWWGPHQTGAGPGPLRLAGLVPDARYLEADAGTGHLGASLMRHGLPLPGLTLPGLTLPGGAPRDYGSALVRLTRLPG